MIEQHHLKVCVENVAQRATWLVYYIENKSNPSESHIANNMHSIYDNAQSICHIISNYDKYMYQ